MKKIQNPILLSLAILLFGVALFIWPGIAVIIAIRVVGAGLLAGGCVEAFLFYRQAWGRNAGAEPASYSNLATGLGAIALGVLVLLKGEFLVSLFPVMVGVVILINGILNVTKALELKKVLYEAWKWPLIMGSITLAGGILILVNPFSTVKLLVRVMGGILVYDGVTSLWIHTRKSKAS